MIVTREREDTDMEGPMDRLFGHTAFDLNNDGKIDGAEWAFINEVIFKEEDTSSDDYDDLDDFEEEF